jgi:hypothetical protein
MPKMMEKYAPCLNTVQEFLSQNTDLIMQDIKYEKGRGGEEPIDVPVKKLKTQGTGELIVTDVHNGYIVNGLKIKGNVTKA